YGFEELAVALLVMADADKRQRGLRNAILPLLKKELIMASWVYEQGRAAGVAQGETRGEANAVLRVLVARGIVVSEEVRERILSCTDLAQLDAWLDRAVVATRAEELLNSH